MSRSAVDGRTQRRAHNIGVVVDAMLQLLAEGRAWPSAADIAARAGLSERSVYRYFDDLDALARAAVDTQITRADHLFQPLAVDLGATGEAGAAGAAGDLERRIARLVAHRLAMFDEVGPIVQAARARATLHEAIAEGLTHRRAQLRAQLQALFAPELAAAPNTGEAGDLLAALEVLTGFEALQSLRVDQSHSAARTRRILHRTLTALLA